MARRISGLIAAGALAALAACTNTKFVPTDDLTPQAPTADQVYAANVARLPVASSAGVATLTGTVSISGFTVLDAGGVPVAPSSAPSKIMARLLDPEDDILATTYPSNTGKYTINHNRTLLSGKLRVTVRVQEDLNGDTVGGDTIDQLFPVSLVLGRICTLNIALTPATAGQLGGFPATSGSVLIANIDQADASGVSETQYGSFYADGVVVYDQDRDGVLEPGDDFSAPDENANGWADGSEGDYGAGGAPAPGDPPASFDQFTGLVLAVDIAGHTLTVREDGTALERRVLYDPVLTTIEPYIPVETGGPVTGGPDGEGPGGEGGSVEPGYDYLPPVPLDTSLVGRKVAVFGYETPDGFQAQQIVVIDVS